MVVGSVLVILDAVFQPVLGPVYGLWRAVQVPGRSEAWPMRESLAKAVCQRSTGLHSAECV